MVASSISFISISVSTVYASQRTAPSVAVPGHFSIARASQSASSPPATSVGARSQPLLTPCSSSQSPSSSSASLASIGPSLGALATRSTASSCSLTSPGSATGSIAPPASMASLCRMPAIRSRSAAVALTAAAAGLFSSWVSPADSEPRASSRSRSLTSRWLFSMPRKIPSSRWIAIGNHARTCTPHSSAGSWKIRMSVTASTVAPYVCWARSVLRYDWVAPK